MKALLLIFLLVISVTLGNFSYGEKTVDTDSMIKKDPNKKITDKESKSTKKEKTESAESVHLKNELKAAYQISKLGEKLTATIKQANDNEAKALKKLSGDAKSIYSKTKNTDAQKLGQQIQEQIKDSEQDKKRLAKLSDESKKITKQIISVAKENKITKSELDKPIKENKKDDVKNTKPQESLSQYYNDNAVGFGGYYGDMDELAKLLFDAPTKSDTADNKRSLERFNKAIKELEAKKQDQKDPDAPPESLLDDLDPTIRGPDVNEPKSELKPDPKNEKPKNTEQQNSDAPPESILDDIDIDYGPDASAPKKPQESNPIIDWQRIAHDDMLIIKKSMEQELRDQVRDRKFQLHFTDRVDDLTSKIRFSDSKKMVIDNDSMRISDKKTDGKKSAETKPKSTKPEPKTEKPVIQKDTKIVPETMTESKPSNTKPTLSIPKQVTYEATGPSGANVPYSTSSQDKEDGSLTPTCDHPSGALFPIGTTSVICTVTDSNNNSISGTFTITVRDTTPPAFAPFQPTEGVRDDTGVQVFFDVTATDLVDGNVSVSCNYQSGYKFPPGVTTLTCSASDSRGNQSTKNVQITVTVTESG